METSYCLRPSVHDSRVGCNTEKPQLPGISYLLQLSGYADTVRDPCPSLLLSSSPTATSTSEDFNGHCNGNKDSPFDYGAIDTYLRRTESPPAATLGKQAGLPHNSLSGNIRNGTQHVIHDNRSLPLTTINSWNTAQGNIKAYRITKSFESRKNLPAPRAATSQLTYNSRRLPGLNTTHSVRVAQPSLFPVVKTHHGDDRQQGRKPDSSSRDRLCSRLSISTLLSSSPSNLNNQEDLHNVANDLTSTVPAISSFLLVRGQPGALKGLNIPSHSLDQQHIPLRKEACDMFTSAVDPAKMNERLTRHYLCVFFDQTSIPMFDVLPRHRFIEWAMGGTHKSLPDRILLYALMSCATLFCNKSIATGHRAIFRAIVYRELDLLQSQPCLQIVHALLFLTFTEYGDHRYQAGSNSFARCADTISALRLNIEQVRSEQSRTYNFTASVDAECRRRTFWAAFCFDVHMRLDNPTLQRMNECGIAVRLPCISKLYNCRWLLQQPLFEHSTGPRLSSITRGTDAQSDMAHMIQLTRIHADISAHISRNEIVRSATNRYPVDQAYRTYLQVQLRDWVETYRGASHDHKSWGFDEHNRLADLGRSQVHVQPESIGGLHMLYYHSQMQLNRWIYHRGLEDSEHSYHARHATLHAIAALRLAEQVVSQEDPSMRDHHFVSKSPSTIHAILAAVDIITAVGRVSDILEPGSRIMSLMYSALDQLGRLGSWWGPDVVKYELVKQRIQTVFRSAEAAWRAQKKFFYCSNPINMSTGEDFDLVYGPDRKHYLRLAYSDTVLIEDKDIYRIDTSRNNELLS